MNLAYPYQFDPRGRTGETGDPKHIRDLIEQLLFTMPGERVMRPDFGSGVTQLLFAPNSVELAGVTQMLVQAALQQWLSQLIVVQGVHIETNDMMLQVTVQYSILETDQLRVETFQRTLGDAA